MHQGDVKVLLVVAGVLALATLVLAVRLAFRLVGARRLLRSSQIPLSSKALFWGSLIYLVCPVDLLPDPIYLDDAGFLLLALRSLHKAALRAGLDDRLSRRIRADRPGPAPSKPRRTRADRPGPAPSKPRRAR
ncbi:YkvA family protein [Actinacidiphila yeochonensis]|uniref:YkvA family protein n=1 Tax=Actinacidiphila yeochonensis TaxID=89050 RepID=UPI0007C84276|nr:YkvA family protein [Actinacidiphila yeochonensis]